MSHRGRPLGAERNERRERQRERERGGEERGGGRRESDGKGRAFGRVASARPENVARLRGGEE